MTRQTKSFPVSTKSIDLAAGTFEAVVAVFGNVDLYGDRIRPGAFAASLDKWRASGDPIPIIFSHRWDDLDAHIGAVDPNDVIELLPGDELLPDDLKDLGGLYVRNAQLDDDASAKKVGKLLKSRRVKEFSFAYDVNEYETIEEAGRHITDLVSLELFEIGPTLKGVNPETQLVAAKAALAGAMAALVPDDHAELVEDAEILTALKAALLNEGGPWVTLASRLELSGVKEGRRNASTDAGRLQRIHDLTVELDAKCKEPDGDDDEKSLGAGDVGLASSGPDPARIPAPGVLAAIVESDLNDL